MPWCKDFKEEDNGANGSMFTYSTLAGSMLVILIAQFMDIEL
jgi:hypothetical protein